MFEVFGMSGVTETASGVLKVRRASEPVKGPQGSLPRAFEVAEPTLDRITRFTPIISRGLFVCAWGQGVNLVAPTIRSLLCVQSVCTVCSAHSAQRLCRVRTVCTLPTVSNVSWMLAVGEVFGVLGVPRWRYSLSSVQSIRGFSMALGAEHPQSRSIKPTVPLLPHLRTTRKVR